MRFLFLCVFYILFGVVGYFLEAFGIKSPPFYAFFGTMGLGLYLILDKLIFD